MEAVHLGVFKHNFKSISHDGDKHVHENYSDEEGASNEHEANRLFLVALKIGRLIKASKSSK